jgi:hypothetical protein
MMIKLSSKVNLRSRKGRITLSPITQKRSTEQTKPLRLKKNSEGLHKKQAFSCLKFFWQHKYISLDDYLTACKYLELYKVISKMQGGPKGFDRKVVWCNAFETSKLGWIQSELSFLDQDCFKHCSDDEVLKLWKILQKFLNQMPLSYRVKFNELMFNEAIPNFHYKEKLYLKAFQQAIPAIKSFMGAFWKQKKPS